MTPPDGAFAITSPDHVDASVFAPEVTCEACGFDANKMVMPGLEWTAGPDGTAEGSPVYVMAKEDGRWLLTACQNTPVL